MSEQAKKIGESAGATLARFGFKPKPAAEPSAEAEAPAATHTRFGDCLLYTSPSPRDS